MELRPAPPGCRPYEIMFDLIDFKVSLIDGAYHDVDSSVLAFEIAARAAFREASEKVAMKLLEPIMKVEVVSPEDYVGMVIGGLNSRRGMIVGQEMRGDTIVISALAPYANLWNFSADLRRATNATALCSGDLAGLAVVPMDDGRPPAVAQRMTA
jgi:elongation factor G